MRVALVTSQPVFALGFRALAQSAEDIQLVAEAGDARSGFCAIDAHKPEVLIMDVALPGMNGIHAIPEVRRRAGRTRVLLVADWARERDVLEALAAGAQGFASKNDGAQELLGAIRAVGRGQLYVAPAFRRFISLPPARISRDFRLAEADVLSVLSPREREVLDLVVRGWRNRAIARELCVSIKTVDTHRTRINRKLGCNGASELIRFAAENDLIRRPPSMRAARPERVLLLMMDDDPQVRAQICRELVGEGARQIRTADLGQAVAELHSEKTASLLVVDAGGAPTGVADLCRHLLGDDPLLARTPVMAVFENTGRWPAVRAAASLPHAGGEDRLVTVLERAAVLRPSALPASEAVRAAT
jgi:two-component system, NarL family, response regulator NreC